MLRNLMAILLLWIPAAAEAQDSAAQTDPEYRVGAEDILLIQIWERPDLSGEMRVDLEGKLLLPLLGSVPAEGKTTPELVTELTRRYNIVDPKITKVLVSVSQFNSRNVTVVGEVRNPGRYGFQNIPDLWQVLLKAGGATSAADLSRVRIVHGNRNAHESPSISVDLSMGMEETHPDSLPTLRPKDTVVVPSLGSEAASGSSFQILGSVRSPGRYRLGAARNVVEALAVSGGALPEADLSRVYLTRTTASGVRSYELDLQAHMREGQAVPNFALKTGDTISVPDDASGFWPVLGEVTIRYILPIAASAASLAIAFNYRR